MSVKCSGRCRVGSWPGPAERALRRAVERAIEEMLASVQAMIGAMDLIDGDADLESGAELEPDADGEPSLGWSAPLRHDLWDEMPAGDVED
jgi:hypothetical protein